MVTLRRRSPKATPEALLRLFGRLAIAARSSLPLGEALQILAQDEEGRDDSRELVRQLATRMRAGASLSDALKDLQASFDPATVALVRKAEEAGSLAPTLQLLTRDYAHQARFRVAVRGALSWPAVAFVFFLLALLVMALWVIPAFAALFASFEAQLPAPTRLLIATSRLIREGWFVWVPLLVLAAIVIVRSRGRREWMKSALDSTLLRAPGVRTYVAKTLSSRLASILLAAAEGAPLREALGHLRATSTGGYSSALAQLEARVAQGLELGEAVHATPELPARIRVAVEFGRRTEQLPQSLREAIEVSDEEAEHSLVRFEQAGLVAAYIVMGVLVGFLVVAMYLPIFKMGSVI